MQFEVDQLKWGENGLIPAVVTDVATGQVLMLAYMSKESLQQTLQTGQTWFYSRSRQRLWHKGEQSGHVQMVEEIFTDCDQDTLLVRVRQVGPGACHEGHYSCFHYHVTDRQKTDEVGAVVSGRDDATEHEVAKKAEQPTFDAAAVYSGSEQVLNDLFRAIMDRKANPTAESYTAYLFKEGINKILKKVGEECTEVVIAAKDPQKEPLIYEVADLFYHMLVLLAEKEVHPREVFAELQARQGNPPHR